MQKAQERREARDAARRDRLLAQAASVATPGVGLPKRLGPPLLMHQQSPTVAPQSLQLLQPIQHQQMLNQSQLVQGLGTTVSWDLQQPWTPYGVGPIRNNQQQNRTRQHNNRQDGNEGEEDEEDYDDDDDDDGVIGPDGAFHLTAPRGFRYVI